MNVGSFSKVEKPQAQPNIFDTKGDAVDPNLLIRLITPNTVITAHYKQVDPKPVQKPQTTAQVRSVYAVPRNTPLQNKRL